MEKIAIKEAIASGEWLQYLEKDVNMKIRILSIRNVDLAEIDDINEVNNNLPLSSSKLLMLGTEIINVSRVTNYPPKLLLKDQDDFQFAELEDSHLKICSDFAHIHHLYVPDLIPKLKYKVEYLFLVPDDDAKYYIDTPEGTIKTL
ncbi:MAG: hypothetical protein ABFC90_01960 [Bacteroidales bacterium]|nr:hypothetical protein [Bacteroidales bacterium]MCK9311036.1 hypothetical protein [Bacteroidales bacterium]